jgi:hypothetical protein
MCADVHIVGGTGGNMRRGNDGGEAGSHLAQRTPQLMGELRQSSNCAVLCGASASGVERSGGLRQSLSHFGGLAGLGGDGGADAQSAGPKTVKAIPSQAREYQRQDRSRMR